MPEQKDVVQYETREMAGTRPSMSQFTTVESLNFIFIFSRLLCHLNLKPAKKRNKQKTKAKLPRGSVSGCRM
jgi:hypothetical protein